MLSRVALVQLPLVCHEADKCTVIVDQPKLPLIYSSVVLVCGVVI